LVAGNVQQKSAAKNNQTQQQAAVNNAQQSWGNATNNFNAQAKANPAPYAGGATIGKPTPGAYGGGTPQQNPMVSQVMQQAVPRAPQAMRPSPGASNSMLAQILSGANV
jgi:hypothetical protein